MFKKLQRKFMVLSTLVLLLVIGVVGGVVYWIATGILMSQTSVLVNLIFDNDGTLPSHDSDFDSTQERFLALNVESIHEARFFSAKQTDEGIEIVATHIAAISEEDEIALAEKAFERRGSEGRISIAGNRILHYARRSMDDDSVMVVMIDSTSRYGLVRLVMMYMFALWLTVLILYVIVMGHFSKKLIHPFIENDEKQKRFITNASHELKTPLAVISANTEMTEVLGGKSKWTESTRRQIKRLQTLIEDLVVLTRLDEMKESELTDVDLSAVVAESSEPFRSVAENDGKRFTADIAPDIRIKGDKRGLQQIVSILLDNAVKYCDANGAITVRLESRARGKGAKIVISNTYVDGKDVDTSRFFERFYRQDESHNSEKSGFGIGLSMAKEITERMKGKLRVNYSGDTISFTVEV